MLHHLDAALESLVRASLPGEAAKNAKGTVRMGPPTDEAGISLFLHRIEEDVAARSASWTDELDDRGRVIGRALPPRRYRFCYLLTASDHELLGAVLTGMAHHVRVPAEHLPEGLHEAVDIDIANPGLTGTPVELWAGLDRRPRTYLDVVLTTTIVPAVEPVPVPPSEVDLGVAAEVPPAEVPVEPPPLARQRIRE